MEAAGEAVEVVDTVGSRPGAQVAEAEAAGEAGEEVGTVSMRRTVA